MSKELGQLIRKGAFIDILRNISVPLIVTLLILLFNPEYGIMDSIFIGTFTSWLYKILNYVHRFIFAESEGKKLISMLSIETKKEIK